MLNLNKQDLLLELIETVKEAHLDMRVSPELYSELGSDDPIIDVRLHVLIDGSYWLSTGSVDYDQLSGDFTACSIITLDSTPEDLMIDLLSDLDFQMSAWDI